MQIEPQVRELLTCSLLSLDPRIVDKRAALHGVLVEVGLFLIDRPAELDQLQYEIDNVIQQKNFLRDNELEKAVDDCVRRGTVRERDDKYELASEQRKEMQAATNYSTEVERRSLRGLVNAVEVETGEILPVEVAEEIFDSLKRTLTEHIYQLSLPIARGNLTIDEMVFSIDDDAPLTNIESVLREYIPQERRLLRSQIKEGVVQYFRELPPELKELLKLIHHTVVITQILNLDPTVVRLQKDAFSRRRLYLDTNVVLAYLFEAQPHHQAVREVIQASISLQCQLFIAPTTLAELTSQVERAKHNYTRLERDPLVSRMAANADDAILATFVRLGRTQPSLQWDAFIAPFEELEEILLRYNILVEEELSDGIESSDLYKRIRKLVTEVKPDFKSENVIKHDSLCSALIYGLRDVYTADQWGQVVWLLTIDHSLRKVQRLLHSAGEVTSPYCMQVDEWGEVVVSAQNIIGVVFDDFIGYLAQARLGAVANPQLVQLNFLETIRDAEVDVDRLLALHPAQVRNTLTRLQTSREARSLLEDVKKASDSRGKNSLQLQFNSLLDEAIEESDPVKEIKEEYDRKIELLQIRVEERDAQVAKRDEKITELETRVRITESSLLFRVLFWLKQTVSKLRVHA